MAPRRAAIPGALVLIGLVTIGAVALSPSDATFPSQKIPAPGTHGMFGVSLAVDGDRMIAGSWDRFYGPTRSDEVFILARGEDGAWNVEARIVDPRLDPTGGFGHHVGIQGSTAVVGMYAGNDGTTSVVYVYHEGPSGWELVQILKPQVTAGVHGFGWGLAFHDDRLVVGAPWGAYYPPGQAAGFVFDLDPDGTFTEVAKLTLDPPVWSGLGYSVAFHGDQVALGAPGELVDGRYGSIHVFERQGNGAWAHAARLLAPPEVPGLVPWTGVSLAMGDGAIVSSASFDDGIRRVTVFDQSSGAWGPGKVITPSTPPWLHGLGGYGTSMQITGPTLLVGSPFDNANTAGMNIGAVDVYHHLPDGGWVTTNWLRNLDYSSPGFANLGASVALSGERLYAGAPGVGYGDGLVAEYEIQDVGWGRAYALDLADSKTSDTGLVRAAPTADVRLAAQEPAALGASLSILEGRVKGNASGIDSSANVAHAVVPLPDGRVLEALGVATHARSTCAGNSAGFKIARLLLDGVPLVEDAGLIPPNTVVDAAGVRIVLNEQHSTASQGVVAKGVHVTLNGDEVATVGYAFAFARGC
ncbi:MAG: hypothetical protein HY556_04425 [Euryarchaeota archaeon]|nr:hypothetical protein [Euryarchaeota archaeon]